MNTTERNACKKTAKNNSNELLSKEQQIAVSPIDQLPPDSLISLAQTGDFFPFFTPIMKLAFQYHLPFQTDLQNLILNHLIVGEVTETNALLIDEIIFATTTPSTTFLPLGNKITLINYDYFEMEWEVPQSALDTFREDERIDRLFLYVYNVSKNTWNTLLMDLDINPNPQDEKVTFDCACCAFEPAWQGDTLMLWGIWKRFALDNPNSKINQSIANSKSSYLGYFFPEINENY